MFPITKNEKETQEAEKYIQTVVPLLPKFVGNNYFLYRLISQHWENAYTVTKRVNYLPATTSTTITSTTTSTLSHQSASSTSKGQEAGVKKLMLVNYYDDNNDGKRRRTERHAINSTLPPSRLTFTIYTYSWVMLTSEIKDTQSRSIK